MFKELIVCLAVLGLVTSQTVCTHYACNDGYGYYATTAGGFDLYGGDESQKDFDNYADAMKDAKNYINGRN